MKTIKQVREELTKYLLTQDTETVCKLAAYVMMDLHKLNYMDHLSLEEQEDLNYRVKFNSKQLMDFAKNGPKGELKLGKLKDLGDGLL